MHVNDSLYIVGSDRSSELVKIAHGQKGAEALVADALDLPFNINRFDFAISIAVIHHFSTPERRIEAVRTILSRLQPTGTALIYVWALEQKNSRRGWDEGMDQDVMVPWVLQKKVNKKKNPPEDLKEPESTPDKPPVVWNRYYHLYKQGELEGDVAIANGQVIESGYERDNWWAIIKKQ